ncbi:MAG: DUF2298 domain-containing protein, partial [Chloroflexota bacterium]
SGRGGRSVVVGGGRAGAGAPPPLPLCLALFAPMADRGYGLSKAFGLLVFSYAVWVLGVTRLVLNGPIAYILALLVIASGSVMVWRHAGRDGLGWRVGAIELIEFIRRRRGLLLIEEAVLLASYLGFLLIRRHNPDISGTEKFMDFAFMNAVTRSSTFPPFDPWLAPGPGFPEPTINYYHFGYLIQGLLVRMTGVHPAVGFNIALSMLFGLTAIGAFSLCYSLARDMVAERERRVVPAARRTVGVAAGASPEPSADQPAAPRALVRSTRRVPSWSFRAARPYLGVGALGAFLLLVSGNLWTFLRRVDGSGMWDKDFWQGVGWNATRVLVIKRGDQDVDYTINEFPAFSFLLGDLHPHVLALPFTLLAVGLGYAWLMRPPLLYRWALAGDALPHRRAPWGRLAPAAALLPGGLILGALYFLNSWDFPAYFVLAQAAALGGGWWLRREEADARWLRAPGVVALSGVLALGLYLPFLLTFKPPVLADQGLPLGVVAQRSYLNQFLQFWGLQLLLVAPPLMAVVARGRRSWIPALTGSVRRAPNAALIAREAPGWELAMAGAALILFVALADRLGSGALMLAFALALASGYGALRALRSPLPDVPDDQVAGRRPLAFALTAICLGALLLAGCEIVYIRDFYGGALCRMNTVFKFYYQAWLLFAIGGAVTAYWLLRTLRARRRSAAARAMHWAYTGLGIALVIAGLHFPLRVAWLRTDGFRAPPALNGMAWMARFHPEDYAAAEWLRASGVTDAGTIPVVLEATGGAYSEFSRFATQTGFPTVLGWDQHERLWRGAELNPEIDRRKADVDTAYSSAAFEQAKPVLDKYGVTYVVVGYLEQQKYGAGGGLAKFQETAQPGGPIERVFSQGQTAVYKVRR